MAKLVIAKQDACFVDARISKSKAARLHFVVRRTPFALHLAFEAGQRDFNSGALECQLLHGSADLKLVDGNPLEFLARPSADGLTCVLDCRVLELSSHSAAKSFIIKIAHVDDSAATKRVEVLSQPIVSVAKQQQIRNKISEVDKALHRDMEDHSRKVAKRPRSEDLIEILSKIVATQDRHGKMLERATTSRQMTAMAMTQQEPNLEQALDMLVRAYEAESEEERPRKLRRLLDGKAEATLRVVSEIGSVFSGFARPASGFLDEEPLSGSSEPADHLELNSHADSSLLMPTSWDGQSHAYRYPSSSATLLGLEEENVAGSTSLSDMDSPFASPADDDDFRMDI